ncbi:thioesterase-like superfamily-domain-containing protein [Plectosphaerella plurivora]|uniref:Thioesterase-like superfamily-domain-containing protein n=1 Tax=Plectosphaerella plurivora TaxID=936078 RepID=A0A9P8V4U6_9PEZI|nr:thioesterase-like superfamily-domain-containing protein [Plectosphaerella plurivora]
MTDDLAKQLAIRPVGDDEYVSEHLPIRMGNTAAIAYGGTSVGIALNAAGRSVPDTHKLYSALGHFLGPATLDQHMHCKVFRIRDTKSFATRRIEVSQEQKGKHRVVLHVVADFHVIEGGMFDYSAGPVGRYSGFETSPTFTSSAEALLSGGKITQIDMETTANMFAANTRFFENRVPPESVTAQNFSGVAKGVKTSQDHLDLTAKTSGDWYRLKSPSPESNDQLACLGFLMDGGLSFLPLAHQNLSLNDVGACSSLDFALRVHQPHIDLRDWHLRERSTSAGGHGGSFSEGRLWDRHGRLIASASQQSILRGRLESL